MQMTGVVAFEAIGLQMAYAYPLAWFDGVTTATCELALPRNALVDAVKLRIQARRVESVRVQEVAQVRSYSQGSGHELVIDFGTPRTVSGVSLPAGANVTGVYAWLGSQFNTQPALAASAAATRSVSFPELRTERLRVTLSAALPSADLAEVRLNLPEPPSGLAIAIDGAAPVWTHTPPVQPRAGVSTPDENGWDADSTRIVDLTAALAALAGDALAGDDALPLRITLSTAVPCQLAIALHGTPLWRCLRRVRFGNETATALDFAAEGQADLSLPLPPPAGGAVRRIDEIRWLAEAQTGPERTVPPLGPDAAPGDEGLPLAEALVTPERAAIARLPPASGLQTLQAMRLPLQATGDGAEARVVLWQADAATGMPAKTLPQATSDPVTLAATDSEAWVSFVFAKPVALPAAGQPMPWAALVVSRGTLSWALAAATGDASGALDAQVLRRGPPNGPWKALPAPLHSAGGVLDARARLRLQGLSPKTAPLAPLTLALVGHAATAALNPTPKGEPGALTLAPGLAAAAPTLRLTSHLAGRLTLRDIDVVSDI